MKTLILLFVLATTALTAQSLSVSYDTVTVDTYYNGVVISTQNIEDNVTAKFDFDNGEITIQGEKGIIYLVKATKTGQTESGSNRFKGYIGQFEIFGLYNDDKTQVIIDNKVFTFSNKPMGNKT